MLFKIFKKKEKFPLRYFFMAAGTLVMALYAVRNNAFYALFAGLVGAWQLRHLELPEKIAVPLWKLGGIGCIIATVIFWCIPFDFHVLEIDLYPFWNDQAVLEVELKSEEEAFLLPPEIRVIREVTEDPRYLNSSLARELP